MKTKPYTSMRARKPESVRCRFTERDLKILLALNNYRYLRTSQIKRLVFADTQTLQSARRRLRCLYHHGYIGVLKPFIQVGHGSGENAYFIDRHGADLLKEYGESVRTFKSPGQVKHRFLRHALELSEFHLLLELALQNSTTIELQEFVCDYEVQSRLKKTDKPQAYRLYHQVHDSHGQSYVVHPDALIILQGKGALAHYQALYFLEIDRGTEKLTVIRDKLKGYNLYMQQQLFKKFGEFKRVRLLIQTNSPIRADNIHAALKDQSDADFVWVTSSDKVTAATILNAPIWIDHQGKSRYITKTPTTLKT